MSYKQLIIGFTRAGLLGYGGGPASIPLIRFEAVENYKWMDDQEFGEILAMANALPGPISTKMSAYIGYRIKGYGGAAAAILATMMPSVIAMILLLSLLYQFKDSKLVAGAVKAIGPVIGVMLGKMTYDFFMKSKKMFGWTRALIVTAFAYIIIEPLQIHPAIAILIFLVISIGVVYYKRSRTPSGEGEK